MSGVNKAILVGRVGKDIDIRYTPNGDAISNVSVATSESWKDKSTGKKQEKTEWHRVVVFGKLAEIASKYLRKGSQVYFEGKIVTRKWTDKQSVERYSTEIVVDSFNGVMQMLGDAVQSNQSQGQQQGQQQQGGYQQQQGQQNRQHQNNSQGQQRQPQRQQQQQQQQQQGGDFDNSFDDDIPF